MDFGACSYCKSQNLIQNGSFENYTAPVNCSGGSGGFDNYANFPVNHVVDNWYSLSSPDYFTPLCNGANNDGAPLNIFGYSQAKNGNAYAGFLTYLKGGEIKEYIYQQLSQPLQSGKTYCLSFFVSRVDRAPYSVTNVGACFSNNVQSTGSFGYVTAIPQVVNQSGFITDTTQWTQIQGCFTANGGEQYITIGKFNTTGTDTLNTGTNNPIPFNPDMSYYYIDDITLIDQTTVGVNELDRETNFAIYPNPNIGIFTINSKDIIQKIEVTNIAGQLLLQESINSKTHQLQLNQVAKGIYFIKVNYTNGLIVNKKVIVNP